jgi:predicted peptidase
MIARKLYLTIIMALTISLPFSLKAQDLSSFDKGSFMDKRDTIAYRFLFPENFDPTKKYALILVLHGAGERGNDNKAQLRYGPKAFLNDTIRAKYPAIVIFPQCPKNGYWSNVNIKTDSAGRVAFQFREGGDPTPAMKALLGMLSQWLDKPFVDKHRVYVGGLSMGGMGTFELLRRKPDVFAAAFAICGGDNTLNAKIYAKKVPLWIFHGAKDHVVPADHSIIMVNALKAAGANPKFTLYANVAHDSWNEAFAEPDLVPWLFEHRK